jgi:preprotein translocase subunit YajC
LGPTSTLPFQTLSHGIFFSSSRKKEEKNKKENHKEKKKCREGKELSFKLSFCPFTFGSFFCRPTSTLLFQMLSHGIFFFSNKRNEKKNHIEKKKCKERREFSFKLLLCSLTFGSRFCPPTSTLLFQILSPSIFLFFSSRRKKKLKKNHREKKKC